MSTTINSERWQRVKEILDAGLALEPAARAAFLTEACDSDEALRKEIESLIASNESAGSFFDTPVFEAAAKVLAEDRSNSAVGRSLGYYRVLSLVATGGMGEVYLADDTRLGRKVALKLLPSFFTQDHARLSRFRQEARAASSLNHPNILTVYEIGEFDSTHFIATEYVEGVTLRERMTGAQMELQQVLEVAAQVASALSAAHEAGIVHRDIKPENIMLRGDGIVKVLDFGLAKLTEGQAASKAATTLVNTEPGVVMGTARYMSPEQALGLEVDARTDVWSLGCVIYEMAAARAPFDGPTIGHVIVSIMEKEPPPLGQYLEEYPRDLESIVSLALTKEKEGRYQTAQALLADLRGLKQKMEIEAKLGTHELRDLIERRGVKTGGGQAANVSTNEELAGSTGTSSVAGMSGSPSSAEYIVSRVRHHKLGVIATLAVLVLAAAAIVYFFPEFFRGSGKSIDSLAILPFTYVSNDLNSGAEPDREYLSDGMTESIINSMSQLAGVKVIARSSVFRYKGREIDLQEVGRDLRVRAALTGRIVQRGDDLLISVELVDLQNNTRLWGEQYNRKLLDIVTVQEEISREISEKLRLRLSGEEKSRLSKRYTDNADAFRLYLKGRYFWNKRTREGSKQAMEYFQQAIEKDPTYALAYAAIADTYSVGYAGLPQEVSTSRAKAAAEKALEIDPYLAEAYAALAVVKHIYYWDWAGAERDFRRAIELKPNYASAHGWYGNFLVTQGRFEESLRETTRAQEIDPLSPIIGVQVGNSFYWSRRYDEAIVQYRKVLELDEDFWTAHYLLSACYETKGLRDEAIAGYLKAHANRRDVSADQIAMLKDAYAASGWNGYWQKELDLAEQKRARGENVSLYEIAWICVRLGKKDQAFEWLEKAYQERGSNLWRIRAESAFDSLHQDPRFQDLVRRLGLPP